MTDVPLPDMPDGPSPEEVILAGLRKRYLELAARVEWDAREMMQIKDRVRVLGRGQHPIGDGFATISPNTRFDPKLAEEVLRSIHPDLVDKCSVPRIDSKLTKEYVSGEVYAQCQREAGEDKVSIQ